MRYNSNSDIETTIKQIKDYILSPNDINTSIKRAYSTLKLYPSGSEEHKQIRGDIGELINKLILDDIANANPSLNPYTIYNAIFSGNSKSTEVDSILVTNKGVYVIETKCLYGTYFVTSDGNFTRKKPTPLTLNILSQNSSHCRYIYNLVKRRFNNLTPYSVKGIIVVAGDCKIIDTRKRVEKEFCPICYPWELVNHINMRYDFNIDSSIVNKLILSNADFSKETRKKHIEYCKSKSK